MWLKNKKKGKWNHICCTVASQIQTQRWVCGEGRKSHEMDIFFFSLLFFSLFYEHIFLFHFYAALLTNGMGDMDPKHLPLPSKTKWKLDEVGRAYWEPESLARKQPRKPSTILWHRWHLEAQVPLPSPPPPQIFLSLLWKVGANPCTRRQWIFAVGKCFWG